MKTTKTTNGKTAISENVQPELFYIDQEKINQIDNEVKSLISRLSNFVDEFQKLAGQPIDEGNFKRIITIASNGNIAGALKATTDLIREITGKEPTDTRYFEKALTMVQNLNCKAVGVDTADTLSRVTLENETITLNADIESFKNIYRSFAVTDEQKARLSKVRELCNLLQTFVTPQIDPSVLNVRYLTNYDRITGTFQPERSYVLSDI